MPRLATCLIVVVAGVASLAAAPAAAAPRGYEVLSDERTLTSSAWVERVGYVRAAPSMSSRRLARLTLDTWHGSPELVVVLGSLKAKGRDWYKVRYHGLGRRTGWLPAVVVSADLRRTRDRLVLDRRRTTLKLLRGRRVLFRTRVGVGARGSPTPSGNYFIRERLGPFRNVNTVYGALAFGTSAYSPSRTDWPGGGQVGIHGTNQSGLIPGFISNGCVRLHNSAVRRLGRLLRIGTPLKIV